MRESLHPLGVPASGTARARALAVAAVLATALVASAALAPGVASADTTTRLQAEDNVAAAIALSDLTFADGATDMALLGRDDLFADSLASGVAQGALDAPLLLTAPDALDPRTLAELQRLGVGTVLILGGDAAISPAVDQALQAAGLTTERVFGPTRIETAVAVAQRTFPVVTQAVVARAYGGEDDPTQAFADTLATGAFSAATAVPVLYSDTDALAPTTRAFLESSDVEFVTIAGGTAAVSEAVEEEIRGILEDKGATGDVTRLAGATRAGTAVAMAEGRGIPAAEAADRVLLVEGRDPNAWAPGFAAAAQAGGGGAPLVLAENDSVPPETADYLDGADGRIPLVCTPYVSEAACDEASRLMGNEG